METFKLIDCNATKGTPSLVADVNEANFHIKIVYSLK